VRTATMTSHESHQGYGRSKADYTVRRIIPGRMSNYHEPASTSSHPRFSNYPRQPNSRRTIPDYRANYLEITAEITTLDPQNDSGNNGTGDSVLLGTFPGTKGSSSTTRLLNEEGAAETQTPQFGTNKDTTYHQLLEIDLGDSSASQDTHGRSSVRRHPWQKVYEAYHIAESRYHGRIRRSKFYGWRMGVLLGTCASSLVLLCNIALVIIGHLRSGYDKDGVATVFEGDEISVSRLNTFAHILINALSTVLLSMSNYTMQVLNSPTRREIDKAHASGRWFDVGLLSLHNLRIISRKRATICLLLALSSLPLHLL
jgi:hypothetical protein